MFTTPETQLYKSQYDMLYESTEANPYLKYSSRASKNKALKTSDKRIIQAINENKASIDSLSSTLTTGLISQNAKIGNLDGDATLNAAFQATGFNSLADGIIKLHEKATAETKNIYFIYPKIISTTNFPEIYVPMELHAVSATARYSVIDNSLSNISQDIKIELQHTSKDNPDAFTTFKELTIPVGLSSVSEELDIDLPVGIMRAKILEFPSTGLKNVSIVVTSTEKL